MKQQYIILGILILVVAMLYYWTETKMQVTPTPEKVNETKRKYEKMEIKRTDIEQTKDNDDIVYDLIQKYYPEYDDENFYQLNEVSQTFALIIDADGQINNGGIIQFIDNGTGNRFHETIDAAKRINSKIFVELLTRAAEQFPNGQIPKNWEERRNLYDELSEKYIKYKTFDELNPEEKEIVLKNRIKYGVTTPLSQCSFGEKNRWSDTWEELDSLYYDNSKHIIQSLIDYLKKNAVLID